MLKMLRPRLESRAWRAEALRAGAARAGAAIARLWRETAAYCAPRLRAALAALGRELASVRAPPELDEWLGRGWRKIGAAAPLFALACGAATIAAPAGLIAVGAARVLTGLAGPGKTLAAVSALDPNVIAIDRLAAHDSARWRLSDGWSNGAWTENDWRRSAVSFTAGGATITMAPNLHGGGKPFSSGELSTHETWRYGYFETRMRVPRGEGVVTGFFTFTRERGRSSWQEIDIEILGSNTREMELAYHVGGQSRKKVVRLPFDAADGFHTYAFEWRPDVIRWYVDNQLVHEVRGASVERMTLPQRFYLNLWGTDSLYRWAGRLDPSQAPWFLEVSCVAQARAYRGASLCGAGVKR